MIKGILTDMDGVILDSEKLYVRFWCEAGQACGFPMERKHALGIRSMARPYAIERRSAKQAYRADERLCRRPRHRA